MNTLVLRLQPYLEPVIAAAFFVFWAVAETGRHQVVPGVSLRVLSLQTVHDHTALIVPGPFQGAALPWWAALLVLCVAMALARIQPLVAMVLSVVVIAAQTIFPSAGFTGDTDAPIYTGFLLVIFGASAAVTRRWRIASLLFAIGIAVAVAGLLVGWQPIDTAIAVLLAFAAWFLGFSARVWQQKLNTEARLAKTAEELNRAEIDLLISRERDEIAQDVHDIMAHSLSVIIAQADGARFVAENRPEAVAGSLSNIADSARASLTDVRMLIETLVTEPVESSSPALSDVEELVERMRTAGLRVHLDRFGDPESLSAAQELAVYRIVQEALTNALKHAGRDAEARIALDWRGPGLAISVTSRGAQRRVDAGEEARESSVRGRGLYGMRQRAGLAGGWLRAGPDEDEPNTYIVTAFVPSVREPAVS